MEKTEIYLQHERLMKKMADSASKNYGFDFDDLMSEFNVAFCEVINSFDNEKNTKFSTYLYIKVSSRLKNLLKAKDRLKRKSEVLVDSYLIETGPDPMDSILYYDSFVNNENEVIRRIMDIVAIYPIPKRRFKKWLQLRLELSGYTRREIVEAFQILKTLFDGVTT